MFLLHLLLDVVRCNCLNSKEFVKLDRHLSIFLSLLLHSLSTVKQKPLKFIADLIEHIHLI